jgi:hypothetical protein
MLRVDCAFFGFVGPAYEVEGDEGIWFCGFPELLRQ